MKYIISASYLIVSALDKQYTVLIFHFGCYFNEVRILTIS